MGERSQDNKHFGQHVRQLREARGLSREQLAEASTLDFDTLGRLEHGEFSPPLLMIRKLARGLSMQLSELFERFEDSMSAGRKAP